MKEHYCFLEKFNNYFNRKIIMFTSLEDYQNASKDFFIPSDSNGGPLPFDFNPNDNVTTEIIANDVPFTPDYILIFDNEGNITTRWFIVEEKRNRKGQWIYSLRRDVITDNIETLLDAPIFVQKGMLSDDDPFIFNSEGMSFNQIKKSETLLKDFTGCAWIVGYVAKNVAPTDVTITVPDGEFVDYVTLGDIATAMGVDEGDLAGLLNFDGLNSTEARFTNSAELRWGWKVDTPAGITIRCRARDIYKPDFSGTISKNWSVVASWQYPLWSGNAGPTFHDNVVNQVIAHRTSIYNSMSAITGRVYLTSNQLEILKGYLNRIVFYNGEYYQLSLNIQAQEDDARIGYSTYSTWPSIASAVDDAVNDTPQSSVNQFVPSGQMAIFTKSTVVYIQMEKVSDQSDIIPSITTKISSSRRNVLNQVFDMFAIPLGNLLVFGDQTFTTKPDSALTLGAEIAKELDTGCYDIQLLPYCPIADIINGSSVDLRNLTEDKEFSYISKTSSTVREIRMCLINRVYADAGSSTGYYAEIGFQVNLPSSDVLGAGIDTSDMFGASTYTLTALDPTNTEITIKAETTLHSNPGTYVFPYYEYNGTERISVIFWANKNSFSRILNTIPLSMKDSAKVESECNKYRLVSPNYQGSFDFNVAKNGGSVPYFMAECTYKPYTPYIKVTPSFSYLYGTNFGDCRGLICGGDFSLPRFSSAWENYELNNKNYQNIFNREIQNLDFEQNLAMRQELITGALGTITSGAVGAGAGAKVGGGYGAIAGAVLGTTLSAVGFATDVDIMAKQQREQKALAIDKFNYNLGNIKALPYTITKVGSFDINSKIWPFLEFYTCTDEEKEALENKIRYESMTVMRIGSLRQFMNFNEETHYFKGELIRNDEIADDPHTLNAIYEEFLKGVYI